MNVRVNNQPSGVIDQQPNTHRVGKDDTLDSVARQFGVTKKALLEANEGSDAIGYQRFRRGKRWVRRRVLRPGGLLNVPLPVAKKKQADAKPVHSENVSSKLTGSAQPTPAELVPPKGNFKVHAQGSQTIDEMSAQRSRKTGVTSGITPGLGGGGDGVPTSTVKIDGNVRDVGIGIEAVSTKHAQVRIFDLGDGKYRVELKRGVSKKRAADLDGPLGDAKVNVGVDKVGSEYETVIVDFDLSQNRALTKKALDAIRTGDPTLARELDGTPGVAVRYTNIDSWKSHRVKVGATTKLTDNLGVGMSLYHGKVHAQDRRVSRHPTRSQVGADQWYDSGGVVKGSVSIDIGPVIGAGKTFEFHALTHGQRVVTPNELPFSAEKADGFQEGEEVILRSLTYGGVGLDAAWVDVVLGGAGMLQAGLSIGPSAKTTVSNDEAVRFSMPDKKTWRVLMGETVATQTDITAFALSLGLNVNRITKPPSDTLEGVSGGGEDVVEEVGSFLAARAAVGVKTQTSDRQLICIDFDKNDPKQRAAFDLLMKKIAGGKGLEKSRQMVKEGTGRFVGSYTEHVDADIAYGGLSFFGMPIVGSTHRLRHRSGVLVTPRGRIALDDSEYRGRSRSLWGGGQAIYQSAVGRNLDTGKTQHMTRLRVMNHVQLTSPDELRNVEKLASYLNGTITDNVVKDHNPFLANVPILSEMAHGRTRTDANIYIFPEGVDDIVKATGDDGFMKVAEWVKHRDGTEKLPLWMSPDPKVRAEARALLEEYSTWGDDGRGEDWETPTSDYEELGGADIDRALRDYEAAKDIAAFFEKVDTNDEVAFAKAFAELGNERRFDFATTVAAIKGILNDPTSMHVERLEMVSHDVEPGKEPDIFIAMHSDVDPEQVKGKMAHPRSQLGAFDKPPAK